MIISKLEVQVGGSSCFDLADGSDSLVGTYLEIVRPEKLVFTWSSAATYDKETVMVNDLRSEQVWPSNVSTCPQS